MSVIVLILLVLGLVLVVLGAFGVTARRVSLPWLGVACWMLAFIVQRVSVSL